MNRPGAGDEDSREAGNWRFAYLGAAIAAAFGLVSLLTCGCFFSRAIARRNRAQVSARQLQTQPPLQTFNGSVGFGNIHLTSYGPASPSIGQPSRLILPRREDVKLVTYEAVYVTQPGDEDEIGSRGRDLEGGQLDNCLIGLQVWPPTFSTIHTLQSPAATGTGGLSTTLPPLTDSRT